MLSHWDHWRSASVQTAVSACVQSHGNTGNWEKWRMAPLERKWKQGQWKRQSAVKCDAFCNGMAPSFPKCHCSGFPVASGSGTEHRVSLIRALDLPLNLVLKSLSRHIASCFTPIRSLAFSIPGKHYLSFSFYSVHHPVFSLTNSVLSPLCIGIEIPISSLSRFSFP